MSKDALESNCTKSTKYVGGRKKKKQEISTEASASVHLILGTDLNCDSDQLEALANVVTSHVYFFKSLL